MPTPPMGWDSYDAWGTSITEDETLANAQYLKDHLLAHGWEYLVIDARWYDAVSSYDDRGFNKERAGARLAADEYGLHGCRRGQSNQQLRLVLSPSYERLCDTG